MKGFYSGNNSCVNSNSPNLNRLNDTVLLMNSPKESMLMRYLRSGYSPSDLDHSSSANKSRTIVNYFKRSGRSSNSSKSPLSTVDQNLEDDVLVMDGILVDSMNSGSRSAEKFRSSAISWSNNLYKTEFCLRWEKETTEAYRHIRKFQIMNYDPYYSTSSGSYTSKSSTYYSPQSSSPIYTMATLSHQKAVHLKFNEDLTVQSKDAQARALSPNLTAIDWSPIDDGIAVKLPSTNETPSRNDVDQYIESVLYGPTKKDRPPYTLLEG